MAVAELSYRYYPWPRHRETHSPRHRKAPSRERKRIVAPRNKCVVTYVVTLKKHPQDTQGSSVKWHDERLCRDPLNVKNTPITDTQESSVSKLLKNKKIKKIAAAAARFSPFTLFTKSVRKPGVVPQRCNFSCSFLLLLFACVCCCLVTHTVAVPCRSGRLLLFLVSRRSNKHRQL